MKTRLIPAAGLVLALLAPSPSRAAGAKLVKYKDWAKSPELTYLATDEERKAWKKVASDEEAEKFVALFWAKRDPDPKTEANEFRQRFEALVKIADEKFTIAAGDRGALTERGKLFVLAGPPKTYNVIPGTLPHAASNARIAGSEFSAGENPPGTTIGESIVVFTYEAQQLPEWAGTKGFVARFAVEQTRDSVIAGENDVRHIETAAIKAYLKRPELKEVPAPKAAAAPAAPAKPAVDPAAGAALEAAIAKEEFGAVSALPVTQADGGARLMLQAFLEGALPAAPVRVAWLVRAKGGAEVERGEEAATPQPVLKGFVVDRAVAVGPGEYEVAFAVLDASGAVLRDAKKAVSVPAAEELRSSPLFLAVGELPADPKSMDAPFVFAGRKFVARGDGKVRTTDGLSYLVRLHGPGVDPETKKALLKPRVKIQPKGKKAMELPAAPDEPIAVVEGAKGQPPMVDVAGTLADANIGEFFKPGEYTFFVSIEDAVKKTKLELKQDFVVVIPDK